jgi:hypothetical protein
MYRRIKKMKMETVLFGTYEEIKKWYDNLNIVPKERYVNKKIYNTEFKPFEEQLNKKDIAKIQMIGWFETELDNAENGIPEIKLRLMFKKVCLVNEIEGAF